MIFQLYFLLSLALVLAWNYNGIKRNRYNVILFSLIVLTALVTIIITRDGSRLPDYGGYVEMFKNVDTRPVENSFIIITEYVRSFSSEPIWMFLCYALISVTLKYYAIYEFSPSIFYSLAVWMGSFFLLQEMIQIRGAVAGSLLLCLIPTLYNRKYFISIIIILLASWFHRSALAFTLLLFINPKSQKWTIWIIMYSILAIINILNINIVQALGLKEILSAIKIIEGDYYDLGNKTENLNLYAPYILLQTITCFVCMYNSRKIEIRYPYGILCTKICFIGILFYSLPMGVVSLRLAELFSTVFIFTYPLLLFCFGKRYLQLAKVSVSVICIAILSNFIFIKNFIISND